MELEKADGKKRLFMIGNDAIALGAIAGGVASWLPIRLLQHLRLWNI